MVNLTNTSLRHTARILARNPVTLGLIKLHLRLLPESTRNAIFSAFGRHLLKGQTIEQSLHEVEGKRICLCISDLHCQLSFVVCGGQLAAANCSAWDLRISGYWEDFYRLILREEDPDTLFFQRKLKLEGDTEIGLWIKNFLDSMEYDWRTHFETVFGPRIVRLYNQLKSSATD